MLDYTENKWIDYIEERYFNRGSELVRDTTINFKKETPVEEIFDYYNPCNASLAVLIPYQDWDDDYEELESYTIITRQPQVIYWNSKKDLPEIDLYFDSTGEKYINIDRAAWDDNNLTQVLLAIDETIAPEPEVKHSREDLFDMLALDLQKIDEFNFKKKYKSDYEVYLQKEENKFEIIIEIISDKSITTGDISKLDTYFPVTLYIRQNKRFYRKGACFDYYRSNPGRIAELSSPEQILYPLLGFTSSAKFLDEETNYKISLDKLGIATEVINDENDPFTYDLTTGAMCNGSGFLWTEAKKFTEATKKIRQKLNLEE